MLPPDIGLAVLRARVSIAEMGASKLPRSGLRAGRRVTALSAAGERSVALGERQARRRGKS